MKSKGIVSQLASATVLAIGLTVVWAVASTWCWNLSKGLFRSGEQTDREQLMVTFAGEPLIVTNIGGSSNHSVCRKLDGTPVEYDGRRDILYPQKLEASVGELGLLNLPFTWQQRLGNTSDLANPPVYWHLVRNSREEGHAYFVGYDSISKRKVGYLARNGFRASLPPEEDWFDVGNHKLNWGIPTFVSGAGMRSAKYQNDWTYMRANNASSPPDWIGFVLDRDQLLKIDYRRHTVETFWEAPGATALRYCYEPRVPSTPFLEAPDDSEFEPEDERFDIVQRLLIRYPSRVVVWDLKNDAQREFALPKSLHGADFEVYSLGGDRLLIQYGSGYWEKGPRHQLKLIDSAGNELRSELVNLVGWKPRSEWENAREMAMAVPAPLAWIARQFAIEPFQLLQQRRAPDYWSSVIHAWRVSWPIGVLLFLLAGMATLLTWRMCKRYAQENSLCWCLFVFLFSVPGMIAYRLAMGQRLLKSCPECGEIVPRDRDACARCDKPFAEPSLIGTEVFA